MIKNKQRAFLKWAGGKYNIVENIGALLPKKKILVEPFVGAGSVFLNTDFDEYVLNDINPDLINLYRILQTQSEKYIQQAIKHFTPETNHSDYYYDIREKFNNSQDKMSRSIWFLYLNRFGYNGLCRYNRSGGFNVPFGRYKRPYFPEAELRAFARKSKRATFSCEPFEEVFSAAHKDVVLYCDPPYAPISQTANFTTYAKRGFGLEQQKTLAELSAKAAKEHNIKVLISNHDTSFTRDIYQNAKIRPLKVSRFISQKGHTRKKVKELIAIY